MGLRLKHLGECVRWALLAAAMGMASGPAGAAEGPFPSTYRPAPAAPVAIVGATILTGTGAEIANATLLIRDGRVEAVGKGVAVPDSHTRVHGRGKWVPPGPIDAPSPPSVYPSPGTPPHPEDHEPV